MIDGNYDTIQPPDGDRANDQFGSRVNRKPAIVDIDELEKDMEFL